MDKRTVIRHLIGFFVCSGLFVLGYIALFFVQRGTGFSADYWMRDIIVAKEEIAKHRPDEPVIFIVGDSNSYFGFDEALLEESLGRPVINVGVFAPFSLDYVLFHFLPYFRAGDTVLLCLYEGYAIRTGDFTDWEHRQVASWNEEYVDAFPLDRKLSFIFSEEPLRVVNRLLAKANPEPAVILPANDIWQQLSQTWASGQYGQAYEFTGLDQRGNPVVTNFQPEGVTLAPERLQFQPWFAPGEHYLSLLSAFKAACDERGVTVYFLWAPTLAPLPGEQLNMSQAFYNADVLKQSVEGLGIPVIGDYGQSIFPQELFFDQHMHLNGMGSSVRTERILNDFQQAGISFQGEPATKPHPSSAETASGLAN